MGTSGPPGGCEQGQKRLHLVVPHLQGRLHNPGRTSREYKTRLEQHPLSFRGHQGRGLQKSLGPSFFLTSAC